MKIWQRRGKRKNKKEKKKKKRRKKDKTAVVICRGKFPIQLRELYMFVDTIGSVYMKNIYPHIFLRLATF